MKMQNVESSNVEAIGYDAENFTLRVRYLNGRTYDYSGVPETTFEALLNSDSVGKYLNSAVKNVHPYTQVS
jgi:hypothetical protein